MKFLLVTLLALAGAVYLALRLAALDPEEVRRAADAQRQTNVFAESADRGQDSR